MGDRNNALIKQHMIDGVLDGVRKALFNMYQDISVQEAKDISVEADTALRVIELAFSETPATEDVEADAA